MSDEVEIPIEIKADVVWIKKKTSSLTFFDLNLSGSIYFLFASFFTNSCVEKFILDSFTIEVLVFRWIVTAKDLFPRFLR